MEGGGSEYSVAIVDDDPVVRRAMGLLVEHVGGFPGIHHRVQIRC